MVPGTARSEVIKIVARGGHLQFEIAEANDATRRIRPEAGRAVAVQFACTEESPGSAEQDAG